MIKQQRFKSEKLNVFTEGINEIALSLIDDKRIQSINSIETHTNGARKDLVNEKDKIECNNIIQQ